MSPCPPRRCCYCKSGNHYIHQCDADPHLEYIFESNVLPDFRSMKIHVLKRLCSIIKQKTNEHKNELVSNLEVYWTQKHGKVEEMEEVEEKEPCAICLEKITGNNSCITQCGHHFCLTCLLQQYSNNNSCPLCREKITENAIEIETNTDIFEEYPGPMLSRTVSYSNWDDEEPRDYFEVDNVTIIDIDDSSIRDIDDGGIIDIDDSSIRDIDIIPNTEIGYQPIINERSVFEPTIQPTLTPSALTPSTLTQSTSIYPVNYNETQSILNNNLINRSAILDEFSNHENNQLANEMIHFIHERVNIQFREQLNNHINERVIEQIAETLNNIRHTRT